MAMRHMVVEKIGNGKQYKVHSFDCKTQAKEPERFKKFQAGQVICCCVLRRILGTNHWDIKFVGDIRIDVKIK